jgi:hypothetical protein
MSVSTTNSRSPIYTMTGSATPLVIGFPVLSVSDLVVKTFTTAGVATTLTYSTDYSVSLNGLPTGGTVTLVSPPASGTCQISRATAETQDTTYTTGMAIDTPDLEDSLDKLTLEVQDAASKVVGGVVISGSFTTDGSGAATVDLRASCASVTMFIPSLSTLTCTKNSPAVGELAITGGAITTAYTYLATGV